jgi:hypothetical protein
MFIVAAMILSSTSAIYADTTSIKFTDIDTNWAKQNIINVYNKGLMNGITETLFKPSDKVTNYQALVSIARMTNAKEKYDLEALESKYKVNVLDKYNVPSYASKEVAYCIEAGIIKAEDVSGFAAQPYISKQVISYNIGRAFGVTYDPLKTTVFLGFADSMFILQEYKPYIRHLVDLGIISSTGDANKKFNPTDPITRDVFAKMMDIASDKYNNTAPTIPTYPTTPPTVPTIPETPTTPTPPPVTTPTVPETPADYTGIVEQVIIEYGTIVFQIPDANNQLIKTPLKIADDITCVIDGVESALYWKIKNGDKVFIYLNKEGKVSKLIVDSKIKKHIGTIESLLITDKMELNIKGKDANSKKFYITTETKIIKNKSAVKYDALKVGDNVTLTAEDLNVIEINADSNISTDSGIIESIVYTRTAAPKVTMTGLDGKMKEFFIRKNLDAKNILVNDKGSSVYDLRPGMHVKVELENDEITKLTTIKTETNSKMDGTIKFINTTFNIIVLSQYDAAGKEITKEISVAESEITDVTLTKLSLDKLKVGDNITIFVVTDAGKLKASLIILNN